MHQAIYLCATGGHVYSIPISRVQSLLDNRGGGDVTKRRGMFTSRRALIFTIIGFFEAANLSDKHVNLSLSLLSLTSPSPDGRWELLNLVLE